jgi:hypothetical protein
LPKNSSHTVRGRPSISSSKGRPGHEEAEHAPRSRWPLADDALEVLAVRDQVRVDPDAGGVDEGMAVDLAEVDGDRAPFPHRSCRGGDLLDAEVRGEVVQRAGGDEHQRDPALGGHGAAAFALPSPPATPSTSARSAARRSAATRSSSGRSP